ncbi:type II secretion system F family protein [uncultured Faecalicoccus sp.]|uniref:type II secretion system F family protein n=1 Tax=uncultured Faecalicoccus sp. TaxID=1971760 RepID=UPI002616E168|nr:type II secretion system F family protein [uncultured Faecalicoccus sp.]
MEQFTMLMEKGLDTHFMIEMTFRASDLILERLEQGDSLIEALSLDQSSFFKRIRAFNHVLSLKKSIQCALELEKITKGNLIDFVKKMIYPFFLLSFTYLMILFFDAYILPGMMSFTQESNFSILSVLKILYTLFFLVLGCTVFLCVFLWKKKERRTILYRYGLFKIALFKKILTLQFSVAFCILLGQGLSTSKALHTLFEMDDQSLISIYAREIYSSLEQGNRIEKAISVLPFDTDFIRYFQMGLHTSNLESMLSLYNDKLKQKVNKEIQRMSLVMQCISYLSVGIVVLVIYQLLLMPLNLLNSF